jgi:Mg-chelatase subunit ChlD
MYDVSDWTRWCHTQCARDIPGYELGVNDGIERFDKGFAAFQTGVLGKLYNPGSTGQLANDAPDWARELDARLARSDEFARVGDALRSRGAGYHEHGMVASQIVQTLVHGDLDTSAQTAQQFGALDKDDDDTLVQLAVAGAVAAGKLSADKHAGQLVALGAGSALGVQAHGDPREAAALSQRILSTPSLARILELAGRMVSIAIQQHRTKPRHGVGSVADIEQGGDIARLIPSELMGLAHPKLKRLTQLRVLEKRALQFRHEERKPEGCGPVVVCVDYSVSMAGRPALWAKATMAAMLYKARLEHRPIRIIGFHEKVCLIRDYLPPETAQATLSLAHEICELLCVAFDGGGTNFVAPMRKAIETVDTEAPYKKADIVFVTDGHAPTGGIPELLADARTRHNIAVYGVLLSGATGRLDAFCDEVTTLAMLAEEAELNTTAKMLKRI